MDDAFLDQYCFSVHARRKLMRKFNNYNLMTMNIRPAEIDWLLIICTVIFIDWDVHWNK